MYQQAFHSDKLNQLSFLVTGGAGFIGSHLVEYLLKHDAGRVVVLDNFATGSHKNIEQFKTYPAFELVEADIADPDACFGACKGINYVLHQAALGSVPRSIAHPLDTNQANITGFLNLLEASHKHKVKRFVYASSSSVYGDSKELPKKEENIGKPLSPYAVTKRTNELYARVFYDIYGLETVGLRYFNIFGPRQNPKGPYAAAIPLFIDGVLKNEQVHINGDGEQTRDFTFVENAVQANIKATFAKSSEVSGEVFNIAVGDRVSINELFAMIKQYAKSDLEPIYREARLGDVRDSLANISKAEKLMGYRPTVNFKEGIINTFEWFRKKHLETAGH